MEQSAFEAVMIGVNTFVFIVALSAGILLMSSVIDMVNFANERAIVGMNGTLAENVGVVNERIYTGAQILTYHRKLEEAIARCPRCHGEITKDTTECVHCEKTIKVQDIIIEYDYEYKIKLDELSDEQTLASFIENQKIKKYLNSKFILNYKGKSNGKYVYIFSLYNEENSEV